MPSKTCCSLRFLLIAPVLLVGFAASARPDDLAGVTPILVSEYPCPDPYVFHDGEDWYIFGTGTKPFFLQGKELGVGKMRKVYLSLDYSEFKGNVAQIWGFIVHQDANHDFHAYGTLHLGKFHTVLAYFEPDNQHWEKGRPITRWKFKSVLIGDPARQDWNYYESKIIEDGNARWLMFVARVGRDNWTVAQKLKSWGEIDHSAPRRVILKPEGYRSENRNGPGSMQLVEGGSIFRWKDTYVLLYSVGDFASSNYKLGMAFSSSIIPQPDQVYRTVKLPDPDHIWGAHKHRDEVGYLLQSEKPGWPNFSGRVVVGPGLGSIVIIGDEPWLFFHGYRPDDHSRKPDNRFVYRVPLTINIKRGETPTLSWVKVDLPGP